MKTRISLLLAAAAVAVACSKDPAVTVTPALEGDGVKAVVFTSGFGETVKTSLDGTKVLWEENDEISILWDGGSATAKAAAAGATTTFTAEVGAAETYYAVYPSSTGANLSGETLSLSIPAAQHGTFAEANIALSSTSGTEFTFKNLCALGKFTISRNDVAEVRISTNKGILLGDATQAYPIAGAVTVTLGEGGIPSIDATAATATEIVITPESGSAFAAGDYYFCALPGTFEGGVNITSKTSEGTVLPEKISFRDATLARSGALNFGTVDTSSDLRLSFDFAIGEEARANSVYDSWPLARSDKPFDPGFAYTVTPSYPIDGVNYTFELITPGCDEQQPNKTRFSWSSAGVRFIVFQYGFAGLPAIDGYKLSQIAINHGMTTTCKVIVSKAVEHSVPGTVPTSSDIVSGGEVQSFSKSVALYYYYLDGTEGNTRYYLYTTNSQAIGIDRLHLIYKKV